MLLAALLGIGLMIADHAIISPLFNPAPQAVTVPAPEEGKTAFMQAQEQMLGR